MKYLFTFILSFIIFNSISQDDSCDNYSNNIFELLRNRNIEKVNQFITPIEHSLKIMHWESTKENIAFVEQMNIAIRDSIIKSIDRVHKEFNNNGVDITNSTYLKCEILRNQNAVKIIFECDQKEYWFKVFTDYYYIIDRFKSQFDNTSTRTEEFNKTHYRTEPKPLVSKILDSQTVEILEKCYKKNEINKYGELKDLSIIQIDTLSPNKISIIGISLLEKSLGHIVLISIDLQTKSCNIIKE